MADSVSKRFDSNSLTEWLRRLETLHPKTIELGLDRIRQVANNLELFTRLKNQQPIIVTVAGTNGKGTCVAAMQALLLAADKTVGAYTSPHLLRYNERLLINGQEVSDQQLVDAFRQIEHARRNISLSYFEFGTLAAFLIFLDANVDYWLLEVGLGGRLDAVNLLDADIAIVTSIDLDHQDWLGDTREQIAVEKAGVYRSAKPAICVDPNPPESLTQYARQINANLFLTPNDISWESVGDSWWWQGCDKNSQTIKIDNLPKTKLPKASISAALQALTLLELRLNPEQIKQTIASLTLTGRSQSVKVNSRTIIFDVAHNPAAARFLAQSLSADKSDHANTIAVFAVMADKDIAAIISPLKEIVHQWHIAALATIPRAASIEKLSQYFASQQITATQHTTVAAAIEMAMASTTSGDRIIVFGSFYTVAEGLQWLQNQIKVEN